MYSWRRKALRYAAATATGRRAAACAPGGGPALEAPSARAAALEAAVAAHRTLRARTRAGGGPSRPDAARRASGQSADAGEPHRPGSAEEVAETAAWTLSCCRASARTTDSGWSPQWERRCSSPERSRGSWGSDSRPARWWCSRGAMVSRARYACSFAPTVATNLWRDAGGKQPRALSVRFRPALGAIVPGVWAGSHLIGALAPGEAEPGLGVALTLYGMVPTTAHIADLVRNPMMANAVRISDGLVADVVSEPDASTAPGSRGTRMGRRCPRSPEGSDDGC